MSQQEPTTVDTTSMESLSDISLGLPTPEVSISASRDVPCLSDPSSILTLILKDHLRPYSHAHSITTYLSSGGQSTRLAIRGHPQSTSLERLDCTADNRSASLAIRGNAQTTSLAILDGQADSCSTSLSISGRQSIYFELEEDAQSRTFTVDSSAQSTI